jgi:hypothetical protein
MKWKEEAKITNCHLTIHIKNIVINPPEFRIKTAFT